MEFRFCYFLISFISEVFYFHLQSQMQFEFFRVFSGEGSIHFVHSFEGKRGEEGRVAQLKSFS